MEVKWSAWAEKCLIEDVYNYYREKAGTEKAAEIVNTILDRADTLAYFPERGRIDEDLRYLNREHRYILEYHYKIIYLVEGGKVHIMDLFSCRQDPDEKVERNK